ncbi:hypothetical protein MUK70_10900 [Dyadobacter chenwenxiniae]|uniref:Uncharacterized protein n=1 Tax=Dyadobacter chenwenxiniae TaxID=2906456 RepID=A0A9X1PQI4_9BACT|nr:hypothetical protein [Dyadobacter chenwenxiniae]MCF0065582.1 hypothetical protein [Dyadobacter chenwenxiniae]UON85493.1 hypothetical protein MUK70_10900 [Dyadobacter chenwenxiniae]
MKVSITISFLLIITLPSCNQTGVKVPFGPLDGQAANMQKIVALPVPLIGDWQSKPAGNIPRLCKTTRWNGNLWHRKEN